MEARRVVVVAYDDAELLEISSVTSTLATANDLIPDGTPYETTLATLGGGPVRCSSGLTVLGQLEGRRVTTHWHFARELAECHPGVTVDPAPIFVRDDPVSTSAGVTAALDLTLDFVAEDHGPPLARLVSRVLVTYFQRPGNQTQMSVLTTLDPENLLVRDVLAHIRAHLVGDLSSTELARVAGVSARHLHRLCLAHTGHSPSHLVRRARAEAAADLLESTALSVRSSSGTTGPRPPASAPSTAVPEPHPPDHPGGRRRSLVRAGRYCGSAG